MIEDAVDQAASPGGGVARRYLIQYRVMAFTTATLLIILVFIGLPLQLAAHRPQVVNVVGTIHGFLYIVYLFTAFQLTRRLGVPKWQMALILLAGTVPFCAFVAERKLSRRFQALSPTRGSVSTSKGRSPGGRSALRRRWLSPRALVLHLEVLVIAPGCAVAGWWQATQALAGNTLSWVYSIEWPIFSVLSIVGWWYLIHEDPAAYAARRLRSSRRRRHDGGDDATSTALSLAATATVLTVARSTARLAGALAGLVAVELALGIVVVLSVPYDRPNGWQPHQGVAVYDAHSLVALPLGLGALYLFAATRRAPRLARLTGVIGAIGVAISAIGGLMTGDEALRFAGMAVMFLGALIAGFAYVIPALERSQD